MKPLLLAITLGAAACAAQAAPAPAPASVVEITRSQNPIKLVGEGRLSHAAEYIELSMSVHAECFDTPIAASNAADAAVAKLMKTLRANIDANNPKDGVFSRGGFTQPFSRYDNGRTVCDGTFQKVSTVVMKTSRVESFARDFAEIQRVVLAGTLKKPANPRADKGIAFALLGTPVPQLYYETRETLEARALADALTNARAKLKATASAACSVSNPRLLKFEETSAHAARPIPYAGAVASAAEDGTAVELDAIWINKLLDVYFIVEPGPC